MATLADVAQRAGVSTATVSHVLNNTRFVSERTEQRVREALQATGYRMNPFARALRIATSESIGFVASDMSNPYSTAVMKGIEAATRHAGYTLLVANSDENPQLECKAISALVQRRVDGLIIALSSQSNQETVEALRGLGIPIVLIDVGLEGELDRVLVESREPVRILVQHLIDLGHERIGVLAGAPNSLTGIERIAGWEDAFATRDLPVPGDLVRHGGISSDTARQEFAALLDDPQPPTAILTSSNRMTLGVLEEINARGLNVPDDIALVAFDEPDFSRVLKPQLTCIAQPTFMVGTRAVELILRRISQPDAPHLTVRMRPVINHRVSCCGEGWSLAEADKWNEADVSPSVESFLRTGH